MIIEGLWYPIIKYFDILIWFKFIGRYVNGKLISKGFR